MCVDVICRLIGGQNSRKTLTGNELGLSISLSAYRMIHGCHLLFSDFEDTSLFSLFFADQRNICCLLLSFYYCIVPVVFKSNDCSTENVCVFILAPLVQIEFYLKMRSLSLNYLVELECKPVVLTRTPPKKRRKNQAQMYVHVFFPGPFVFGIFFLFTC